MPDFLLTRQLFDVGFRNFFRERPARKFRFIQKKTKMQPCKAIALVARHVEIINKHFKILTLHFLTTCIENKAAIIIGNTYSIFIRYMYQQ